MMLPSIMQNGANPSAQKGGSGVPIPTPEQIMALTDSHERYRSDLRLRMESDWETLILTPFDAGEGYQEYTSNEPMTYFNKMVAMFTSGRLKLTVPTQRAQRGKREKQSRKERFMSGILKANDERLMLMGEDRLLDSLISYILMRGWYCGRAMLVKDVDTEETYADITPWDPMHVSWGMGPKGLKWICHKSKKTVGEIVAEYGIDIVPGHVAGASGGVGFWADYFSNQMMDDTEGYDVYDWYDEWFNIVVVNGKYAKQPTLHGSPRTPAFFGCVGPVPLIQSLMQTGNVNLVHQGESIFAPNRRLYEKVNLILSTMLQLVALSRNQPFFYLSKDGTKTVKNNLWLEGSQVPLAEGEQIILAQLLEMSKDTATFLGLVSAEMQRGALNYTSYGQLAFQLSGYAVDLLRQAQSAPVLPRQHAVENAVAQIANLICDQFVTGQFPAMHLQGYQRNRDWFDEDFTPDMMQGLPAVQVELKVTTPQDEMQNIQMAEIAGNGPWPKLPMREILERFYDADDPDSLIDAVKEQAAERLLPEAALWTLMVAAENQGRPDLAMFYFGQLIKQGIMVPPRPWMTPGGGSNGQTAGAPTGFSPEFLSAPEQGAERPTPTPQAGPNVPGGTPRPGAQGQPG